jgi:hypothetical protein
LKRFNVQIISKNDMVINDAYEPTVSIKPRVRDPVYVPAKNKKKRPKWTFPISLMYPWKPDDEKKI